MPSPCAAGGTGAGFITLAATLAIVPDIPIASLAILVGIDKFMSECRALGSLEDEPEGAEPEKEPGPEEVRKAQRLAGGLNWLATRTRPGISFYASQISSAATKTPLLCDRVWQAGRGITASSWSRVLAVRFRRVMLFTL